MSNRIAFPAAAATAAPRLKAWLQLLRLPNLFTLPGDTLAGFYLGAFISDSISLPSFVHAYAISFSGVLLYCAGLLHNDYFDRETDLLERPSRPIPSGRVNPRNVLLAGHLLLLGGAAIAFIIGLVPGIIASVLGAAAAIYNLTSKKNPIIGPLNIGLCRGLLFLMGASILPRQAVFSAPVLFCAFFYTLFIASVSRIAARETEHYRSGPLQWAPGVVLLFWFIGIVQLILPPEPHQLLYMALSLSATVWAFNSGRRLKPGLAPAGIQQCIGMFLRGVLLIQPAMVALAGGPFVLILLLLAFFPLSGALGRRFYSS